MHELKLYLVTIQNENRNLFNDFLDKISHQSDIRQGNRLSSIIPMHKKTVYEASLTGEEVAILALSCPGQYTHHTEDGINEIICEYKTENRI